MIPPRCNGRSVQIKSRTARLLHVVNEPFPPKPCSTSDHPQIIDYLTVSDTILESVQIDHSNKSCEWDNELIEMLFSQSVFAQAIDNGLGQPTSLRVERVR